MVHTGSHCFTNRVWCFTPWYSMKKHLWICHEMPKNLQAVYDEAPDERSTLSAFLRLRRGCRMWKLWKSLWMVVISVYTIHKISWFCDYLWRVRRISWWWSFPVRPRISSEIIETAPPRERMRVAWAVCIAGQDNWSKNVPVVCSLEHEELKGAVKHQGGC